MQRTAARVQPLRQFGTSRPSERRLLSNQTHVVGGVRGEIPPTRGAHCLSPSLLYGRDLPLSWVTTSGGAAAPSLRSEFSTWHSHPRDRALGAQRSKLSVETHEHDQAGTRSKRPGVRGRPEHLVEETLSRSLLPTSRVRHVDFTSVAAS